MANKHIYSPTEVSPPGDTLSEMLDERGMSQRDLAERTGLSAKHINQIVKGKVSLSQDIALRFERVLGAPASFWVNRDATYQTYLTRQQSQATLVAQAGWLEELPLGFMRKIGAIKAPIREKAQAVQEALRYFAVGSQEEWRRVYAAPQAAFRRHKHESCDFGAIATWLREGERAAEAISTPDFNRPQFLAAVNEIRDMTSQAPDVFWPKLVQRCNAAGVAVVLVESVPKASVSGVTRWLNDGRKALLQLSLYGKANDKFWFTFFHECCHILNHGKKNVFIEDGKDKDSPEEVEANRFSARLLIPEQYTKALKDLGQRPSSASFIGLANSVGVHPGIIVGQWQHLTGQYSWGNPLKIRFEIKQP